MWPRVNDHPYCAGKGRSLHRWCAQRDRGGVNIVSKEYWSKVKHEWEHEQDDDERADFEAWHLATLQAELSAHKACLQRQGQRSGEGVCKGKS